jgi:hypothetical protein
MSAVVAQVLVARSTVNQANKAVMGNRPAAIRVRTRVVMHWKVNEGGNNG